MEADAGADPGRPVLLFGVGPTPHHVFLAARQARELHLADYLPANLAELRRWVAREPGAHDWRPFVRYTLECEGRASPTDADIDAREALTRGRSPACSTRTPPAEPLARRHPTVIGANCADSATPYRSAWATYLRHIGGLVAPGRPLPHLGAAPLDRATRWAARVPERQRGRGGPAHGARAGVRDATGRRGPHARRARGAGLLGLVLASRRAADLARPTFPIRRGSFLPTSTRPRKVECTMIRIDLKRSVVTLTVMAGLLAGAGPAGAEDRDSPLPAGACATEGAVGIPYRNGVNCRVVEVDGHPRRFVVYVPRRRPVTGPLRPVVFMFHGSTGTGEQFLGSSGWREQADSTGLVAVFPTGLRYRVLDSGRLSTKWNSFDLAGEVDLDERPLGVPGRSALAGGRRRVRRLDHGRSGRTAADRPRARVRVRILERRGVRGAAGRRALAGCWPRPPSPAVSLPAAQPALRPTPMWLVAGALDDRILAQTGPPPLTELPLDPAALLAEPVIDSALDANLATLGLDEHLVGTLALPDSTAFRWPAIGEGPGGGVFRFTLLAGLGHTYPHEHNNDAGFEAAPEFWDFFRTHRLP